MPMRFIKKHDFGVTSEMVKALLVGWDIEKKREVKIHKREVSCLAAAVVIGLCRGLRGEEFPFTSMKVILNIW